MFVQASDLWVVGVRALSEFPSFDIACLCSSMLCSIAAELSSGDNPFLTVTDHSSTCVVAMAKLQLLFMLSTHPLQCFHMLLWAARPWAGRLCALQFVCL